MSNPTIAHLIHGRCHPILTPWYVSFLKALQDAGKDHHFVICSSQQKSILEQALQETECVVADTITPDVLKTIFKTKGVDLLNVHEESLLRPAAIACWQTFKPMVVSQRILLKQKQPFWVWLKANAIICNSQYICDQMTGQHRISSSKCCVIADGVSSQPADPKLRADLHRQWGVDNQIVIGTFGPLDSSEDQVTLIKAFSKSLRKKLPAILVIVGEGDQHEHLLRLIQMLNVQDSVHIIKPQKSFEEYLQGFDVFASTSIHEGRPLSLLKAMAAGKAVVATSVGANAQVVAQNKSGFLVPCGFPERIDNALMRLNAIETLTAQMGKDASLWVQSEFSLETMAKEYQSVYQKLLSRRSRG